MKVLTTTSRTQGARPGDFCHAIEGELVLLGWVCGCAGGSHPGGTCGCGRAFTGANSTLATTTAMVRDLELSVDDVRLAVEAHLVAEDRCGSARAGQAAATGGPRRGAVRG